MSVETKSSSGLLGTLVTFRQQVAIGLVVFGIVMGSMATWFGIWGFSRSESIGSEKTDSKLIPTDLEKPSDRPADAKPTKSRDYQIASIWAGGAALIAFLSALWVFTQPPELAAPLSSARKEVLVFGGTLGLLTSLAGIFLGYRWYESLVKWIGTDNASEAKWVLYAVAVFFAGLLMMFASIQLARIEERENASLRRILYGFNSVFVGLLLLLVLVTINVFVFIRVPNALVTNDSAFTALSDESKRFLGTLDRPVHVYLIMPETYAEPRSNYDGLYADCRGLLSQCEDLNRKFEASYLSPTFDTAKIPALMERLKVKETDRDQFGMLITVGENEEAVSFIPATDLIDSDRRGQVIFQGENKLMTDLMYLTDARAKEKVYFTQGRGELSIEPGRPGDQSATGAAQFLRDRRMTVEPLLLDEPGAKVPDDAAVVVIAGLRRTMSPEDPFIVAIRNFLSRKDRPGKLLVCLPAFKNPQGRVGSSGMEAVLADFGITVDPSHRLLGFPGKPDPPDYVQSGPVEFEGQTARINPRVYLVFRDVRPLQISPNTGSFRGIPIMGSRGFTWQEDDFTRSPELTINELGRDPELQRSKKLSPRSVFTAVAISELISQGEKTTAKSRMMVLGSETFLQDSSPVPIGVETFRQQLFSDTIEWLRERENTVGIPPRKVGTFALEKPIELSSRLVLSALILIGLISLGVSVWLARRR